MVSEGAKIGIPNTAAIGYFWGINGYGLNASIHAPILNLVGIDLGADASISIGGSDVISLDISVYDGSNQETYGGGASMGLRSVVQIYGFHDFVSAENERTRDQAGLCEYI